MKSKYYLWIDLWLNWWFTLLKDWKIVFCLPTPVTKKKVWKKERNIFDIEWIHNIIKKIDPNNTTVCMERLRAMPWQFSQTWFSLWLWSWIIKWMLTVLWISYVEIEPRQWQDHFFPKERKKDETKKLSIKIALEKFKWFKFLKTSRSSVPSDWLTDSALIALYWHNVIETV